LPMRIPLSKFGWPEVLVFPAVVAAAMVLLLLTGPIFLPAWAFYLVQGLLIVLLIWLMAFFRDPSRPVPADRDVLLAPADGKITDIERVEKNDFIGREALRIGIFLSIFDPHINRAPCNVRVKKITYKKGRHKNAMSLQSGRVNESNDLALVRTDAPQQRLLVRQISGAIARRIVCDTAPGKDLTGGERFGMIKFGSRTELYLPVSDNANCLVRVGDRVKAGVSILVRYEKCQD